MQRYTERESKREEPERSPSRDQSEDEVAIFSRPQMEKISSLTPFSRSGTVKNKSNTSSNDEPCFDRTSAFLPSAPSPIFLSAWHLITFLSLFSPFPFLSFCVSHFRPTSHQCSSHNPSSGDYFVPLCPLCHLPPKNWSRNEDPNIAMSLHLDSLSCPALDQNGRLKDDLEIQQKANSNRPNKRRIKRENECQVLKCRKIMMVPIDCKECNGKFCVEHRGVKEHRCEERKENLRNSYRNNASKLFGIAGGSGKKALGNSTSNSNSNSKVNNSSSIGTEVKSKFSKLNLGGNSNSSSSSNSSPPTQSNLSASNSQFKDTKITSKPFNFMDKSDKWVPKPLFGISKA